MEYKKITVETVINATIEKIWTLWNQPEHVKHWYNASDDWHTPQATNNLISGGCFNYRMEAQDGSFGFDFVGIYDEVVPNEKISYTLGDGRQANIIFTDEGDTVRITETFDAEHENSIELQKTGWQAILNNFKKYVELNS